MFESLKKKLSSWLGTEEKVEEKAPKKKKEPIKKGTSEKEVKESKKPVKKEKVTLKKSSKITTKEKRIAEKEVETLIPLESEESIQESTTQPESVIEKVAEEPKKPGFLARLFGTSSQEQIKEKTPEIKEEVKPSFLAKMLESTVSIKQNHIEALMSELEIILLESNVALEAVDSLRTNLEKNLVGKQVKKTEVEKTILAALKEAISELLNEPPSLIDTIKAHSGVYKIIFFGINGSGKTTSLAKLAHYLKNNGISSVLAAGDTFRAASIEQLEIHGQRLKIPVVKQTYGSDPAAVAFDAIKKAEKEQIKCVLIDTAGRMYTKENLIREMEKIIRVVKPDLKIFVGESITGNDATEQARTFNEAIGIDGIILTKTDVDDKGGAALSVSQVTGKPIYFLGLGQGYGDLKPFKKSLILDNLGL